MTKKLILVLISLWWGWTAIIDFIVVPTAFRTVSDFFNAGELGVALFSKLNLLEIIIGLITTVLGIFTYNRSPARKLKIQILLTAVAWTISLNYFFYLTPKINELTQLWKKAEALGSIGIAGIADIQQYHQLYHRIYVGLDTLKLIILTSILAMCIFNKEGESAKA